MPTSSPRPSCLRGATGIIGVNYFSRPSDTLLGILAGLEQMLSADQRAASYLAMSQGAHAGRLLLAEYRGDLKRAILSSQASWSRSTMTASRYLLCDARGPRSAATDTRAERRRFVTNACVYATFLRGMQLGIIERDRAEAAARTRARAIQEGPAPSVRQDGYIRHSLDSRRVRRCTPSRWISSMCIGLLGYERCGRARAVRGHDGSSSSREPRFRIPHTSHFLVSADNPLNKLIHKIAAPAYQGRSSWPTFNVEFADRMLDYDECSGAR